MPSIDLVTYNTTAADLDYSHIMDLDLVTVDGTEVLISTTQFDGVLATWDISGGSLTRADTLDFDDNILPGGVSTITTLGLDGANGVLAGGPLQTITINSDGSLNATTTLATLPSEMSGFQHGISVSLPAGTQAVYGGLAGTDGIGRLDFSETGSLLGHTITPGPADSYTANIAAMGAAEVAGQTYLLSVSGSDNGVTSWAVADDGSLSVAQNLGIDEGLWIGVPTALEIATVGDATFAVVAGAGSNSLSVLEIGDDGSMIIREHLLDTLGTRFGGVTAIEVISYEGKTYVIAGGADDGLSVFVLLEGGQLVALTHIEDTAAMGLDNISAITARGRDGGLDIFVASSTEHGVTQLRLDTGTPGATVTATLAGGILAGTTGNDILQGHNGDDIINGDAGDDIIRDGAGSDVMSGGDGADVFILSQDGATDTITDFVVGEDSIDLSLWPLLRDISQLTISLRSDGMEIRYGDEVLIVLSADGEPIDYRDLETGDVIGGTRLPTNIEPGYPGPAQPVTVPDPPDPPVDQGGPNDPLVGVVVLTDGNLDDLRDAIAGSPAPAPTSGVISGDTGADTLDGSPADDVVIAGAGDDIVNGGAGADTLLGRDGNDTLHGDDGADILLGGAGDDTLHGDNGHDLLQGGDGVDILSGGLGDDVLFGDAGADTFIFDGGADVIADFEQGIDEITLDASLWTGLTSAEDVLFTYGSIDGTQATIDLGDGNVLIIEGVVDYSTLADDIALF